MEEAHHQVEKTLKDELKRMKEELNERVDNFEKIQNERHTVLPTYLWESLKQHMDSYVGRDNDEEKGNKDSGREMAEAQKPADSAEIHGTIVDSQPCDPISDPKDEDIQNSSPTDSDILLSGINEENVIGNIGQEEVDVEDLRKEMDAETAQMEEIVAANTPDEVKNIYTYIQMCI